MRCRKLKQFGYKNIIVADKRKLDLLNQNKVGIEILGQDQ